VPLWSRGTTSDLTSLMPAIRRLPRCVISPRSGPFCHRWEVAVLRSLDVRSSARSAGRWPSQFAGPREERTVLHEGVVRRGLGGRYCRPRRDALVSCLCRCGSDTVVV
jgi:hypothetical protein